MLANIGHLGIDSLIPIGGDDTLSYGVRLHQEGVVIAVPKTMDNDVPGTDYCIGFSTCVTRTIEMTHALRTSAGSHERFLVIEVFGRYAGFTALLPTMAGAANRCVIPEFPFDIELLTELLVKDRRTNPSRYSVVLVSEGAKIAGMSEMVFAGEEADAYGHKKLGGVGDLISERLRALSPKYNGGGGSTRSTSASAPRALRRPRRPRSCRWFGNLALDLILEGTRRLVAVRKPLRQRPDRRRHQPQEGDRRRPPLPARTPAAEVREVREQAGLHHDRRLLRATRYGMGPRLAGAARGREPAGWRPSRAGGRRPRAGPPRPPPSVCRARRAPPRRHRAAARRDRAWSGTPA